MQNGLTRRYMEGWVMEVKHSVMYDVLLTGVEVFEMVCNMAKNSGFVQR
jgi:hypothetical protein